MALACSLTGNGWWSGWQVPLLGREGTLSSAEAPPAYSSFLAPVPAPAVVCLGPSGPAAFWGWEGMHEI